MVTTQPHIDSTSSTCCPGPRSIATTRLRLVPCWFTRLRACAAVVERRRKPPGRPMLPQSKLYCSCQGPVALKPGSTRLPVPLSDMSSVAVGPGGGPTAEPDRRVVTMPTATRVPTSPTATHPADGPRRRASGSARWRPRPGGAIATRCRCRASRSVRGVVTPGGGGAMCSVHRPPSHHLACPMQGSRYQPGGDGVAAPRACRPGRGPGVVRVVTAGAASHLGPGQLSQRGDALPGPTTLDEGSPGTMSRGL